MKTSFKTALRTITLVAAITFAPPSQAFFLLIAEAIAAAAEAIKTSQTVIRVASAVNKTIKTVKAVQSVVKKAQTAVKTMQSFAKPLIQAPAIKKTAVSFSIHRI